ncbi:hypothetical protein HDV05_000276 [Chytridiales sp. JEL 0842]|nr:hypothetical protein HDV05_000276 [Chytridiales sp. JEL 0842]
MPPLDITSSPVTPVAPASVANALTAASPASSPLSMKATAVSPTSNTCVKKMRTIPSTSSIKEDGGSGHEGETAKVPKNYKMVDIRGNTANSNTTEQLSQTIVDALKSKAVPFPESSKRHLHHPLNTSASKSKKDLLLLRSIPTLVLYDDRGLDLFDQITYLPEYYLTNAETDIFQRFGDEMMNTCVQDGGCLIELGVGSMRKTKYLLNSIVKQKKSITYYAVDLSEQSLQESLLPLASHFPSINFVGLLGTYDDSLSYIHSHVPTVHPTTGQRISRTILWLGSSIGNLTRLQAAEFLAKVKDMAMEVGDTFLCGIDRRNEPSVVKLAYDDPKGITREFILNGLDHVNTILLGGAKGTKEERLIKRENFEYISIYNAVLGRHEAYFRSTCAQTLTLPCPGAKNNTAVIELEEGELINIEYSVKYSPDEVDELVDLAGFYQPGKWTEKMGRYDVHLFQRPRFTLARRVLDVKKDEASEVAHVVAAKKKEVFEGVPSLEEFEELWKLWDTVSLTMPPANNYLERPILLRHPYIFYVGHLPAFMDIQLSRCLEEPHSCPAFSEIFERGIDPHMEDPKKCHPHSKVPDQWPELKEVLEYRDACRERMRNILKGRKEVVGRLARVVWMAYEHDAMHIETFLYMLAQSPNVQPPADVLPPPALFRPIADPSPALTTLPAASFLRLEPTLVHLGLKDSESMDGHITDPASHVYGWDNESPARVSHSLCTPVDIQNRPVTVLEYATYLDSLPNLEPSAIPASWVWTPNTDSHRFEISDVKVKTIFGNVPIHVAQKWPVYVSAVQAESYASHFGFRLPTETEYVAYRKACVSESEKEGGNAQNGNFGFRSWVPKDVDEHRGCVGNGWEWTGSLWEAFEGYEKSELYPGYSSDFFDGLHNVVLGASWATVPRIAMRETFRNWYQKPYPYVFATFRCVKK